MITFPATHDFKVQEESVIPFRIETLVHKNHYDITEIHRHEYYEIFLFVNGGGFHTIDFDKIAIENLSLHFLSPGQLHKLERGLNSDGFVILFSSEFFHFNKEYSDILFELTFFYGNSPKPVLTPDKTTFQQLLDIVNNMNIEYERQGTLKRDILQSYLTIFLLKCKEASEKQSIHAVTSENNFVQIANQFRTLIEKHFLKLQRVNEYADSLAISSNHLNEITKKVFGKNASDVIKERIVLEAKRHLLHSNHSHKEIAFMLGFEDPSHFSRFFKKYTGTSPNAFAKAGS